MRKKVWTFLFFIFLMVSCVGLASCNLEDIANAQTSDYSFDDITFESETFNYDEKVHSLEVKGELPEGITVTYENNGKTKVGKYTVKAIFKKNGTTVKTKTAYLTIVRARHELKDVYFNDKTYTYDGTVPKPTVSGNILANMSIRYDYDKIKAEPGSYEAKAFVTDLEGNYETVELTAIVTIVEPTFDSAKVVFKNKEFLYDGTAKSILIESELPSFISVTYTGNNQTEIGNYEVTASFTVADNFKVYIDDIKPMKVILSIVKDPDDMSGIEFDSKTFTYDGNVKSIVATNIPDGVTVTYDGNDQVNAGSYEVTAHFASSTKTYPDKIAVLSIEKALVDMTNVKFLDKTFIYTGTPHSLEIENLPEGLEVTYVGNEKTNVGTYTVTAKFKSTTNNYIAPENMRATLIIEKPTFDASTLTFDNAEVVYDGRSHSILIQGQLPDYITVNYTGNNQTEIGDYEVTASFVVSDEYKDYIDPIDSMQAVLTIVASASDISGIGFKTKTFSYDGEEKSIFATNVPEGVTVTYEGNGVTSVGYHLVTAHFTSASKTYPDKKATIVIRQGKYDMSNVKFQDTSFTYDGKAHSIEVENLPEGLEVTYIGNNRIDSGVYTVTAKFTSTDTNYANPDAMYANLQIIKSKVIIKFIADDCVYDGLEHGVSYEGTLLEDMTITGIDDKYTEAGTYKYLISINSPHIKDLINYVIDIESDSYVDNGSIFSNVYRMDLTIDKATYDYSKIKLDEGSFKYAAGKYSVGMSSVLEDGIVMKIDFGDENVKVAEDGTTSGMITVKLSFSVTNKNFNDIPDMFIDLDLAKLGARFTFDPNGGDTLEKDVWTVGELVTAGGAPVPTLEGYKFKGWVYDDGGEEVDVNFDEMITYVGDITLKAKWGDIEECLTYKLSKDETYYIVSGYTTTKDTEVVILDEYNGLPVKEIEREVFWHKDAIQGIKLGANIEKIGPLNFSGLKNLEYLIINEKVTSIGNGCFSNLNLLKTLEFKGNNITSIGSNSFNRLPLIEELDFSNHPLTSIGSENDVSVWTTFSNNEKLKLIKLPKTLEFFTGDCFRNNSEEFDFTIPSDCQAYDKVGYEVYSKDHSKFVYYNQYLSDEDYKLKFNETVIIGKSACYYCKGLTAFRRYSAGNTDLMEVESYAFSGCTGLIKFVFDTCEIVGKNSFNGCKNLVLLNTFIPSILEFDYQAFSGAQIIDTTIKFNANLRSMGDSVFQGTALEVANLTNVTLPVFNFVYATNLTEVIFSPSLNEIPEEAFKYCGKLEKLQYFSASIIRKYAFFGTKIDVSTFDFTNVTDIGAFTFMKSNRSETEITLNLPKIVNIHAFAFFNWRVSAITAPKIEFIGLSAFELEYEYNSNLEIVIDARGSQNVKIELLSNIRSNVSSTTSTGQVINVHYEVTQRPINIKINSSQKVFIGDCDLYAHIHESDHYDPYVLYPGFNGIEFANNVGFSRDNPDRVTDLNPQNYGYGISHYIHISTYTHEITRFNKYISLSDWRDYSTSNPFYNVIKVTKS